MTALKENRYFASLDEGIIQTLAQSMQLIAYETEEPIFREGQTCQGLYIIASGRVKIHKDSPLGRELIINVFEAGDLLNEAPVFDQLEIPVNAGAIEESRVWLIDADAIRSVISNHPEAAQRIIINLSQNFRRLVGLAAELSFFSVTARLANLLRKIPQEHLTGGNSRRLTQDDLAARIGTVREVVARSLKELENHGAIEVNRGKITIVDRDRLIDWE